MSVAFVLTGVWDGEKVGESIKVEFKVEINSTFKSLLLFFTKFVFTLKIPKNSIKLRKINWNLRNDDQTHLIRVMA